MNEVHARELGTAPPVKVSRAGLEKRAKDLSKQAILMLKIIKATDDFENKVLAMEIVELVLPHYKAVVDNRAKVNKELWDFAAEATNVQTA